VVCSCRSWHWGWPLRISVALGNEGLRRVEEGGYGGGARWTAGCIPGPRRDPADAGFGGGGERSEEDGPLSASEGRARMRLRHITRPCKAHGQKPASKQTLD